MKILLSFLLSVSSVALAESTSLIYKPESFNAKSARVLVVLHGCLQSPEDMAAGTGWNDVAEKENLLVIYPRVPEGSNSLNCWQWFEPENQRKDSGQLYDIQTDILFWKKQLKISKAPVYAAGLSAGAAMVSGLLACFPEDFAGGAIHSGPSYGLAHSMSTGAYLLKAGPVGISRVGDCNPQDFHKPLIIIHGSFDSVVNPLHVKRTTEDFFSESYYSTPQILQANSLAYTTVDYNENDKLVGRLIYVHGLGHAWSGYSDPNNPGGFLGAMAALQNEPAYFSSRGPSATNLIMEFFNEAN